MKLLDIAEVADRTGVPASALRFYEEKGLIAPVGRRGLRRLFDIDVLERLSLIALGRTAEGDAVLQEITRTRWHDMWSGVSYQAKSLLERARPH